MDRFYAVRNDKTSGQVERLYAALINLAFCTFQFAGIINYLLSMQDYILFKCFIYAFQR